MRLPYKPPEITMLGSVTDLTQANVFGPEPDNLTLISLPGLSIPGGDGFS